MRKISFFILSISSALVVSASVWAGPLSDYPGFIPLKSERQAASDLVFNGRRLLPDEARELVASGKIKNLADLEPIESSDLWKSDFPQASWRDQDLMGLNTEDEELEFSGLTEIPIGGMGILISKSSASGQIRTYQGVMDVTARNTHLRKTLLRKIGYFVPKTTHLKKLRLRFKSEHHKRDFVKDMQRTLFEDTSRWIVEGADTADNTLVIQDLLVFEGVNDTVYNLARGYLNSSVIQGRRIFNSLLVPYALTNVTESVNIFSWNPGKLFNGGLVLDYPIAEEFSTPYEDALWISRRILKLSRTDWEEIVDSAEYPPEVAILLVEKLCARRNFLREYLGLKAEFPELPVNSKITFGARLEKGKLKGEGWGGYATKFSGEDPDSPLAGPETWALLKSKVITNLISNAVRELNDRYIPRTDIQWKVLDHQLDNAAKQWAHFIATGEVKKIPFGFWATDMYGTNIIAAREVVAGNYLGSENRIQLADVVGFSVDGGAYIGADGLPRGYTMSGGARVYYVKTWTHLKPVVSLRASLKEPFRNMLVPLLKKKQAGPLEKLAQLEPLRESLGEEEFKKRLEALLKEFKDLLGVGESIILQTDIGFNLSLRPGYGISEDLSAYAKFSDSLVRASRLHIYRKDEDTIHVYRDPARYNTFGFALGLNSYIQVMEMGWNWMNGKAKTDFFKFSLNPKLEENTEFFDNAAALGKVLRKGSVESLRAIQKPWLVEHDFKERDFNFKAIIFRSRSLNLVDNIKIQAPTGQTKHFIRREIGKRKGRDIEALTLDILDYIVDEYTDYGADVDLSTTPANDPADTLKGKSVSRNVTLEGEFEPLGERNDLNLDTLFVGLNYSWKGWSASNEKIQGILNEVHRKFGAELFHKYVLNETRKVQFYNVRMSMALYRPALEGLLKFPVEQVGKLYGTFGFLPPQHREHREMFLRQLQGHLREAQDAYRKGHGNRLSENLIKFINLAESTMSFEAFKILVGGPQNLFVRGSLQGFREGEENGDKDDADVFSHTLGEVGSLKPEGPLSAVGTLMGISGGELTLDWILNRL